MKGMMKNIAGIISVIAGVVMLVSSAKGVVLLSDSFDDGNFTSNPQWLPGNGAYAVTNDLGQSAIVATNFNEPSANRAELYTYLRNPANSGTVTNVFRADSPYLLEAGVHVLHYNGYWFSMIAATGTNDAEYYRVFAAPAVNNTIGMNLGKLSGGVFTLLDSGSFGPWPTDQYVNLGMRINPDGSVWVMTNGAIVMSAFDTGITTFGKVWIQTAGGYSLNIPASVSFDYVQFTQLVPEPSLMLLGLMGGVLCFWSRRTNRKGDFMKNIKPTVFGAILVAGCMLATAPARAAISLFTQGSEAEVSVYADTFTVDTGWSLVNAGGGPPAISGGELHANAPSGVQDAYRTVNLNLNNPIRGGAVYFRMRTDGPTRGPASRIEVNWESSDFRLLRMTVNPGYQTTLFGYTNYPSYSLASGLNSDFSSAADYDDFRMEILKRPEPGLVDLRGYVWNETLLQWDLLVATTDPIDMGTGLLNLTQIRFRNADDTLDRSYITDLEFSEIQFAPEPTVVALLFGGGYIALLWRRRRCGR